MGRRNKDRGGSSAPEPVAAPGPAEDAASSAPLALPEGEAGEASALGVDAGSEVPGILAETITGESAPEEPPADLAPGELWVSTPEQPLPDLPAEFYAPDAVPLPDTLRRSGPRRYRVVGPGSVIVGGQLRAAGWVGEMSERDAESLGACVEEV